MDILIFDDMVQETKESNGKQPLNFHEHRQNIPFGQITGSGTRLTGQQGCWLKRHRKEREVIVTFRLSKTLQLLAILLLAVAVVPFSFLSQTNAIAEVINPKPSIPPELNTILMESTFKIVGDNGVYGTVFVMGKPSPGSTEEWYSVLVTAAHVLEQITGDSATIFFRQKGRDKVDKAPYRYQIRQDGKPLWVKHPKADVAAMYIRLPPDHGINGVSIKSLSNDQMLQDFEMYPGREIKVLGFPLGMESSSAGYPILRTGSIASFPLVPADREKTFLVDFRVFEGNSGGPVYFFDPYWYKRESEDIEFDKRHILMAGLGVGFILGLVSDHVSVTETTQSYLQEVKQKYPISLAKVVHGALIKETIDLLPLQPVPERRSVPLRKMTFLNEALDRLETNIPEEALTQIKTDAAGWERTPTERNLTITSEAVTFAAAKYRINSTLTIVSRPSSGATVKYQTLGKRDRHESPLTAGQTTKCTETVPIGLYYIWTERGGKQTSDPNNVYQVIDAQQVVEITEHDTPNNVH